MKSIILGIVIAATTLAACNSSNNKNTDAKQSAVQNDAAMATQPSAMHDTASIQSAADFPAKEIIANYLQLKNALAKDNGKDAATAGNAIVDALAKVDMKSISSAQMKTYMDIADDLKENAEHIGANAGKIEHQREHFQMLSKDIAYLVKTFGNGGQTLYKDYF